MFQASFKKTPLFLFDTLSRAKKEVVPSKSSAGDKDPNVIQMYTCGPTVHDFAHIGNFRTFAFEDILRRTLKGLGFKLTHVMNITDVDDKTIRKATEKGISLEDYTKPFTRAFFEDLHVLGIESAESYPKATDYIDQMIVMIKELINKGYAYTGEDGSVYYAIDKFSSYGKLSHLKLEDLTSHSCSNKTVSKKGQSAQERDEYDKENASDFVLWKSYDPERDGRIFWQSPWGKGRPGWHLECSCMAMQLLGKELDIHAGGVDNIFPHHENEIAQSEALSEKPFSKLWVHSEHLLVDGKKMSKSLGNFYRLRDLLEKGFSGRQVRYQLIASHYRTQVNFTLEGLEAAKKSLSRIDTLLDRLEKLASSLEKSSLAVGDENYNIEKSLQTAFDGFIHSLCDDLNTPQALAHLFELIRTLNLAIDENKVLVKQAEDALECIYKMDEMLGIIKPFESEKKKASIPQAVYALAEERKKARLEKKWAKADQCRDELQALGFTVKDTPDGYTIVTL